MDRNAKIIESSAACFLRLGYAETSLDEIVAQSGVVKQTIYNHFENKDAVFRASIDFLLAQIAADGFKSEWLELEPEEFFDRLGKQQMKSLAEPGTMDFLRLLVKECRRFPELQKIYAEAIPQPFVDFCKAYIKSEISGAQDIQRNGISHSIAWCYRSAITGFATLSNLAALLNYPIPNRSRYLQTASAAFSRLIADQENKDLWQQLSEPGTPAHIEAAVPTDEEFKAKIEDYLAAQKQTLGEKKLVILSAAIQLLSERGYADTSMEEIANRAKVSKQTVYKHFRSKTFLYSFLAKTIIGQLHSITLPSRSLPLREYLQEFLHSYLKLCSRDWIREYFRVVFGESKTFPLESGSLLLFMMEHGRDQLEAKISDELRGEDVDFTSIAILLRSMMGSFILLSQIYVVAENPYLTENKLVLLSEILLNCLRGDNE